MMFKNILVVTDNEYLAQQFKMILDSYSHVFNSYHFGISPFSNLDKFKESLDRDISIMNMKDPEVVSHIVENFDIVFSVHCKQLFPRDW